MDYQEEIDKFLKGFAYMRKDDSFEDSVDKKVKLLDFESSIITALKEHADEGLTYEEMLNSMERIIKDLIDAE